MVPEHGRLQTPGGGTKVDAACAHSEVTVQPSISVADESHRKSSKLVYEVCLNFCFDSIYYTQDLPGRTAATEPTARSSEDILHTSVAPSDSRAALLAALISNIYRIVLLRYS